MQTHNVSQGSEEWHTLRSKHFCASDAPAVMGASKYVSRLDLLKRKALGIEPEVDAATQARFDAGHEAEAAFRPIAEEIIGDELYPVVGTKDVEGMPFLMSSDGLTMLGDKNFEHKLWNETLAAAVRANDLPPFIYWQLEHQAIVSECERTLFCVSDGTREKSATCWYESRPERRSQLIAGWKQFKADLETYQHVEAAPVLQGAVIEDLPALVVQVEGRVVASNLRAFRERASTFIATIKTELATDQDFANAEKMVKFCSDTEGKLVLVKQQAQAQAQSIDELFRAIDQVKEELRQKRLELEKRVTSRKEQIRADLLLEHQNKLLDYVAALNARLGGRWTPVIDGGFAEAMKGKKTITGLRDGLDKALLNAKLQASQLADTIEMNRKALVAEGDGLDDDWMRLFPDFYAVCTKAPDDFKRLVAERIQKHLDAEQARAESAARASALVIQDQWGKTADATHAAGNAIQTPQAPAASTPPFDTIRAFIDSREWKKGEAEKARAIIAEYLKFVATVPAKKAA